MNLVEYAQPRFRIMGVFALVRFVILTLTRWAESESERFLQGCGYYEAMKLLQAFDACEANHPVLDTQKTLYQMGFALNVAQAELPTLYEIAVFVHKNPIPRVLPFAQAVYLYNLTREQISFGMEHDSFQLLLVMAFQVALFCRSRSTEGYYVVTGQEDAKDRALIDEFFGAFFSSFVKKLESYDTFK